MFKNFKRGPVTTVVGFLILGFGAYLTYTSYKDDSIMLEWASVEVGLFLLGLTLLIAPDPKDDEEPKDEN